jgi:hypothetical protein
VALEEVKRRVFVVQVVCSWIVEEISGKGIWRRAEDERNGHRKGTRVEVG